MTTQMQAAAPDLTRLEQFATKVATDRAIAYNGVLAYLGDRLGLWRALASVADTTSEELAERCGLAERHVREWLATEAAAGYLEYDAGSGRYPLMPVPAS